MSATLMVMVMLLLAGLLSSSARAGDQGIQGDQGDQGIQGSQGDQGDQGVPGEPGADGAPGVVWLGPADLCCQPTEATAIDDILMNGYYQRVATLQDTGPVWAQFKNLIPLPEGWDTAPSLVATVYYSVSATDGDVNLSIGANGLAVGAPVTTGGFFGQSCETPASTGVIYSVSEEIAPLVDVGAELLDLLVQRYTLIGGSSCDDTNTGDVYVHSVKIEKS